jgi:hypothetical protein
VVQMYCFYLLLPFGAVLFMVGIAAGLLCAFG